MRKVPFQAIRLATFRNTYFSEQLLFRTAIFHNSHLQEQPSEVLFFKKGCSKKFCNIHRKTPMLESLFNKVAGLQGCSFIKKRLQHRCFFCEYYKLFKNSYFEEHLKTAASVLNGYFRTTIFREAIFQNSLPNIFLFLTFISLLIHLIHLFH